jgi:hypothetical protein
MSRVKFGHPIELKKPPGLELSGFLLIKIGG